MTENSNATRESLLVNILGVTRKAMADIRNQLLKPETDWYREQNNAPEEMQPVWITKEGVTAIAHHFGVSEAEIAEKKLSAANAAPSTEVSVLTIFERNKTMIEVVLNGEKRMMRVRDSSKWVKGMKVEARDEGLGSVFLVPLKNPRFRGKF